ncbi:hypothetical protein N2600_04340 [Rhizobium sp. WSM1274]|uniref:hypothetical protein n=1 Tax=Rhizobium sp. WSM1274 TaxID=3138254 RepID=UPI0021A68D9A|nr:hypothetical protein [Rhizobium leguminosarum]UWU29205.1 hypothetical protein N2600_04340 [Rhizobium leguminosarum bv. viciae]
MKDADIKRFRSLYPRLWRHELSKMPDGWVKITEELMEALNEIQPPIPGEYGSPLFLMIQFGSGFAIALVSPNPDLGTWNQEKALDVIQAVCRFNWQVCETCEVCAGPSHIIVKEPNGLHQQRLCEHCAEERLAKFEGRSVQ